MAFIFNALSGQFDAVPPGQTLRFPGILSIASGKTFTVSNTLTLVGTDSTVMTFPTTSATVARTDAGPQTFVGAQIITEPVGASGLTITGATQTSSFPALNITQTWNASGTTFTAAKVNVTKTAAANGSMLLNLLVGGSSEFEFQPSGTNATGAALIKSGTGYLGLSASTRVDIYNNTTGVALFDGLSFTLATTQKFSWAGSGFGSAADLVLLRDAANTLAQRNSTAAQTSRLYETYTDASNYSRLSISAPSGGPITFASEASGTGTGRGFQFTGVGNVFTTNAFTAGNTTGSPNAYYGAYAGQAFVGLNDIGLMQWTSSSSAGGTVDVTLSRAAAATLQLGVNVNGTATAQTFQAANAITGSNLAGGNLTLRPGAGTGTGTISTLIIQSPTLGSTGTTAQTQATRMSVNETAIKCFEPLWVDNAAVTGLVAGAVAALTTATIVIYDSTGQAYRIPCVI